MGAKHAKPHKSALVRNACAAALRAFFSARKAAP